jgi:hypothetical protein
MEGGGLTGEMQAAKLDSLGHGLATFAQQTGPAWNQNRDFPVITEYRARLGGIFKRMFLLDNMRLEHVFPSTVPIDVGLI